MPIEDVEAVNHHDVDVVMFTPSSRRGLEVLYKGIFRKRTAERQAFAKNH
jgi:hypothetical protein